MKTQLGFTLALVAIGIASAASAAPECYRHADCDYDLLCLEQICTEPGDALPTCDTVSECAGENMVCDDGFCKHDGVYCENPAGHCYDGNGWLACGCENGTGMDGSGSPADPPPTDEALYTECVENLVTGCGEDAPDIHDECTDPQLATCEAYLAHANDLRSACGQNVEEPSFAETASCCHHVDDADYKQQVDCVMALATAECASLGDCYGSDGGVDGGTGNDTDTGGWDSDTDSATGGPVDTDTGTTDTGPEDAGGGSKADSSGSSSGCTLAPVNAGPNGLIALVAAAIIGELL